MSIEGLLSSMSVAQIEKEAMEEERASQMIEEQKTLSIKGVTIRLHGIDVIAIDGLASLLDVSRQDLMSSIIESAVNDAVKGFWSPYLGTEKCISEFWADCNEAQKQGISYADYKKEGDNK